MKLAGRHTLCPARSFARAVGAFALFAVFGLACVTVARSQEIQLGDARPADTAGRRQHVVLETDTVAVTAAKPDWVELRFHVDPGLHINSHTPHDELLVPTMLDVHADGVKVMGQEYPAGVPLRLDVGAGETLSTYQGEFRVRMQVVAAKGQTVLTGTLRYQACDARSCFPPKSLPVQVPLTAR